MLENISHVCCVCVYVCVCVCVCVCVYVCVCGIGPCVYMMNLTLQADFLSKTSFVCCHVNKHDVCMSHMSFHPIPEPHIRTETTWEFP